MVKGKKIKTSIILFLLFAMCLSGLKYAQSLQIAKEEEFGSRYVLWQARNIEIEQKIKGYINNIDWIGYINSFADALTNPTETLKEFYVQNGK